MIIDNQDDGLALLESGKNVFLTGRAGTGKSFLINLFKETTSKNVKITATTGIAALNIKGCTINSALGIGLGPKLEYGELETIKDFVGRVTSTDRFIKDLEPKICAWDTLVLDEMSMMQGYTLQAIDGVLKEARREWKKPFGGIQMVFVGDALQLPPVTRYNQPIDWCFNSKAWKEAELEVINLKKIWRQDDLEFQTLLNALRVGEVTPEQNLKLQSRIIPIFNDDEYVLLETHNKEVDRINDEKLQALSGDKEVFCAKTAGPCNEVSALVSSMVVPETLYVKKGAKVMACANAPDGSYVNGSTGIVEDIKLESIFVAFENGTKIWMDRITWDNSHYQADKTKQATFSQIPLRLAWACSIHRAQGLTLKKALVNPSRCFAEGQCYVALSRVKDIEDLFLRNWNPKSVKVSQEVTSFYSQLGIL